MAKVSPLTFGKELCDALGLGDNVTQIQLDVAFNRSPTITVERLVSDSEAEALTKVLKRYRLVPADEEVT